MEESVSVLSESNISKWKNFQTILPQILATLSATIGSFGLGTVLGWTSPALPNLEESLDLGKLSTESVTWIASLAILGALLSGIPTGYLATKIGRKGVMQLYSIPFSLGWALIALSKQFHETIYLGRLITGFCGGAFTVVIPMYVSEIASNSLRGLLGSCMILMLVSGILFTFIVGTFVSWFWLAIICGQFPLLLFFAMFFMPESPRYLLLKGQNNEAKKAFYFLHKGNPRNVEFEFSELERTVHASTDSSTSQLKSLSMPVIKPAAICVLLMFFQQLGGINSVTMYTVEIFQSTGPHIDPNNASIVIGIVQVIFVLLSMFLVDKLGRKMLLIGSSILMSANLYILGYFFWLKESLNGEVPSHLAWIPIVTLVGFIIAYSFGMGPIPWLLISELLSPRYKGEVSAMITCTYWVLAFVATKTFKDMISIFQESGCYWIFASICLGGAIFTFFVIPETKNKSSEDIQRYFGDKEAIKLKSDCDSFETLNNDESNPSVTIKIDDNRNETKNLKGHY